MERSPTPDPAHPRPRRGRPPQEGLAEQRREQIVASAFAVFAERGYQAAGIADVARHAGVGQGTVYRYFDSKRELLDHVVDLGFDRLLSATGLGVGGPGPSSLEAFRERIEVVAERLFAMVDDEPALVKLVLVEANAIDEELKARLLGLLDMLVGLTSTYLEDGVRAGWLRTGIDTEAAARAMLMLALPGFLLVLRGEATPQRRERYVAGLVDFVLRGIGAPALREALR